MFHALLLAVALFAQAQPPVIDQPFRVVLPVDAANYDSFGSELVIAGDRFFIHAPIGNQGGRPRVYVYDRAALTHQKTLTLQNEDQDRLEVKSFGVDGDFAIVAHPEWVINLIDLETDRVLFEFPIPKSRDAWGFGSQIEMDVDVNRILFAAAVHGAGGRVHHSHVALYNFETRELVAELQVPDMVPSAAGFGYSAAMQGDLIVVGANPYRPSAERSRGFYLFSSETGELIQRLELPGEVDDKLLGASLTISERYLVVVGLKALHLFDRKTFDYLRSIPMPRPDYQRASQFSLAIDGDDLFAGYRMEDREKPDTAGGIGYHFDLATGELVTVFRPATLKPGDSFGHSVAVDDSRVYFGAPGDDQAGQAQGAVYIFERP